MNADIPRPKINHTIDPLLLEAVRDICTEQRTPFGRTLDELIRLGIAARYPAHLPA